MSEHAKFFCQSCGKAYTWKPELAGKRAQCKCGQMMIVPPQLDAPKPQPSYDLFEDEPTAPAPHSIPPTPFPSATSPARQPLPEVAPASSNTRKTILWTILTLVVLAGASVGAFFLIQSNKKPPIQYKFEDQAITRQLDDSPHLEIKAFLENPLFSLMGMTTAQAQGFAETLYKMGARNIYAFNGRVSRSLVVELPDDPARRQQIIDHYNRYHEGMSDVRQATDEGQRYLKYRLKIAST